MHIYTHMYAHICKTYVSHAHPSLLFLPFLLATSLSQRVPFLLFHSFFLKSQFYIQEKTTSTILVSNNINKII